jgi:hypothetical protein
LLRIPAISVNPFKQPVEKVTRPPKTIPVIIS